MTDNFLSSPSFDYIFLAIVAVVSIAGGLYLLREARRLAAKRRLK